jgi:hypothetical protein
MSTLTETFYIVLLTTVSGVLIKLCSMLYKSKCEECSCLGIKIKRNVVLEEKENEFEILHKQQQNNNNNNNNNENI